MFSFSRWLVFLALVAACYSRRLNSLPRKNHIMGPEVSVNEETLILTHVIFRHGNRTVDNKAELYPKDPYLEETYQPYGKGQLTNAGKRKEFSIGTALRSRYDYFLGDQYYPNIIEAVSTDYNRTKMSLQLVLAGLFPPQEDSMWKDGLYWQPVPYNYHQRHQDKVLLGTLCPKYLELYDEVSNSAEMLEEFAKFKETFDYISEHTGLKVTRFYDVYNLYFGISTEEEWGFQLPEWTETVWPETITTLAIKDYFVAMARTEMRKMATGYFLNKVLEDTKAKIFSSLQPGRKMHLYSAHENNIAELLISLGVFEPHVPNYGAYVILEIHRVDNVYGVMIFYENYDGDGPRRLKMPECEVFCPLDKFMTLVQDYIPPDDLCGR